jgi:hypothetical protein
MKAQLLTVVLGVVAAMSAVSAQTSEGIKVHGDWEIEVRNPDGALVQRVEFKNALISSGQFILARLLRGEIVAGAWEVLLFGNNPDQLQGHPCSNSTSPVPCLISEAAGLQVNRPVEAASAESIVKLSGVVESRAVPLSAQFAADLPRITRVWTRLGACPTRIAGETCRTHIFTWHDLSEPIPLLVGQIVQVKVSLSFSAASLVSSQQ